MADPCILVAESLYVFCPPKLPPIKLNLMHNLLLAKVPLTFNSRFASITTIWLFHLSSLVGIYLGYFDWFITKTPINLTLLGVLLCVQFPIDTKKKIYLTIFIFIVGMVVEWIGVHYGYIFGTYTYGPNLGPKLDGVPLLIGLNWVILTLSTAAISSRFIKNNLGKIILGALLMVGLDVFIEQVTTLLDYWTWEAGSAPLRNYFSWFLFSLFLHWCYNKLRIKGDFIFSLHLYAAQLTFFVFLYGIYKV